MSQDETQEPQGKDPFKEHLMISEQPSFVLFKKTRALEIQITDFLLNIIQGGFLFSKAMSCYFQEGVKEGFSALKDQVSSFEAKNDSLRRDIANQLYAHMILPDMRSDILKLLEGCDHIINKYEDDLILLSVEQTKIPSSLKAGLTNMIQTNLDCVSTLIDGVKAFFSGQDVNRFVQKVYVLEHQVDLEAVELKKIVFQSSLSLARQLQLKQFIYGIEKISDMAEDTADGLIIMSVKHTL